MKKCSLRRNNNSNARALPLFKFLKSWRKAESGGHRSARPSGGPASSDGEVDHIELDEARAQIRDLENLLHVTGAINALHSVEEQLPVIIDALIELTGADRAVCLLYDEDNQLRAKTERVLRKSANAGRYSQGVIAKVTETGEPVFVLDTDLDAELEMRASVRELQLRTVLCAPIEAKSGLAGVFYADSTSPLNAFTEHQKKIFLSLTAQAAVALENAFLHEVAISDPMTGLYNHAFFVRRLDEELKRSARYNHSLSLMLIDIDNFKKVNDTYGHQRGDKVLCDVADAIVDSVRSIDIVARYGGDEFAVIFPETDCSDAGENPAHDLAAPAYLIADRIRTNAAARSRVGSSTVTVSVGVAALPSNSQTNVSELVELADRALYAAKRAGRETVFCATMQGEDQGES